MALKKHTRTGVCGPESACMQYINPFCDSLVETLRGALLFVLAVKLQVFLSTSSLPGRQITLCLDAVFGAPPVAQHLGLIPILAPWADCDLSRGPGLRISTQRTWKMRCSCLGLGPCTTGPACYAPSGREPQVWSRNYSASKVFQLKHALPRPD